MGNVEVDLTQSDAEVIFAQNYGENCAPMDEAPRPCFVRERYASGDAGLKGFVTIERTETHLSLAYLVDWEGITDRFGTGDIMHQHVSEGRQVLPLHRVREVSR
jgi:hypothetical protein